MYIINIIMTQTFNIVSLLSTQKPLKQDNKVVSVLTCNTGKKCTSRDILGTAQEKELDLNIYNFLF